MHSDDRDYHLQRARDERDSASRAPEGAVAAAHLRLSALHMEKARSLGVVALPLDLETIAG